MSFEDGFDTGNGFGGIQETPIPNEMPINQGKPRRVVQPKKREGGIPDPNHVVARPDVQHTRNYDAMSQSGAREARTEQVQQGYAQPGQTLMPQQQQGQSTPSRKGNMQRSNNQQMQQNMQMVQQNPQIQQNQPMMQNPQMIQPNIQMQQNQQMMQNQQMIQNQQMMQNQQMIQNQQMLQNQQMMQNSQMMQNQQIQPNQQIVPNRPKKKKSKLFVIIALVLLLIVGAVVVIKVINNSKQVAQVIPYETSGRYALDRFKDAVVNYDPVTIDSTVGTEDGDSYIAQEWAYVNKVNLREEFIKEICALVEFQYPQVAQLDTKGQNMVDDFGNTIMVESMMNAGESVTVTIPDYETMMKTMDEDKDYILKLFKSSKYTPEDYMWNDELANLMIQYIIDKDVIPTKQVEMTIPVRLDTAGVPYVADDAVLDDALFGSDEFHELCAKFSQIVTNWTGYKDEVYSEVEYAHNPEYDEWLELFLVYFEADGGVYDATTNTFSNVQNAFNKRTSKWEPWYLRDDNNVIQKNEDGTYIVNYFTVKDENNKDWVQPASDLMMNVEKVRQVEDPWVEETGIMYNWIGQNWIQNKYTGDGDITVRVGDGSIERPAGIGTTIITKVLGTDGLYHDVKVALMGYWYGQDGIDYAEKFSSKNRGFTTSSVVSLICYEIYVENLESKPFSFESSEMTLLDRNRNISSRTGTMYGFSEEVYLAANGDKDELDRVIINDWATSTELEQKYVGWGKSFGRKFDTVYFDCLAGTGNIPTYSAYKMFTGESTIEDDTSANDTSQSTDMSTVNGMTADELADKYTKEEMYDEKKNK